MRTCSKCQEEKLESEFYAKGKRVQHYCKPCFNKYCMERWIQRKKDAIQYKGGMCHRCKIEFPYPVYEFHHRNPKEKDVDWNRLRLRSWKAILLELDKCDLYCANCHRLVHHELRNGAEEGT